MPAPTITKHQIVPKCSDNGGAASGVDETQLTRGNVDVHSGCCRTYAKSASLTGLPGTRNLLIQGSVPTCSATSTGMKTFSGDSFKLCGGQAIRGTHSGNGTITGASFSGSTTVGTSTGISPGSYTVSISGSFTSPGNGSFTGTLTGALVGTVAGNIVANVVTGVTYTLTTPGGTATGTSNGFTITGGGTTFAFSGRISGLTSTVNAYWEVEWTNCSIDGIVARMRNAVGDTQIVEYVNKTYCLKSGRITMLNRNEVACDHPCRAVGMSQQAAFALHPLTICFVPSLVMAQCRGGNRSTQYTATVTAVSHALLDPLNGLTDSSSGGISLSASGSGTPANFSITGFLNVPGRFSGAATLTFTMSGGGAYSGSVIVESCTSNPNHTINGSSGGQNINWAGLTGTVTITGVGLPAELAEAARPVTFSSIWGGVPTAPFPTHDYCAGNLSDSPVGTISLAGSITVNSPGPTVTTFGATQTLQTITISISHNDVSFPAT